MAEQASSRFTPQNKTTNERLSTTTVGLVALSDFRKRRAEVLEQQEREAREAVLAAGQAAAAASASDRSQTGTPDVGSESGADGAGKKQKTSRGSLAAGKKKKKDERKKVGRKLLSFGDDDDDDNDNDNDNDGNDADKKNDGDDRSKDKRLKPKSKPKSGDEGEGEGQLEGRGSGELIENDQATDGKDEEGEEGEEKEDEAIPENKKAKVLANTSVGIVPRSVTKAALRKEAAEREALRREFVALQEAVKATEIALPFVFYDGTNIPGGMVRVKKGDFVWVFLDKSRRLGAEMGVGEHRNVLRAWARARVDDLMLVRGTVIIPHHYDFYYFIMNKNLGPGGRRLFDYSAEAPIKPSPAAAAAGGQDAGRSTTGVMVTAETKAAAVRALPNIRTLEGARDDPTMTKVVDRRWYERHKHIYPASTWQKFDPEKDYSREIRKDTGGNTFFFSR